MELLKNIFFFLGSVLGILAFVKTLIEPMVESNRAKWKQIAERITEQNFINLESEIWYERRVSDETWNGIRSFIRDIEQGAEYLRFNSASKKLYRHSLQELVRLFWVLSEFVQVPYWELDTETDEQGNLHHYHRLNKDYFWKKSSDPNAYAHHLEITAETVEKMRIEFRKLSVLSNLHAVQLLFANRIVARDAQLPQRIKSNVAQPKISE